MTQEQVAHIKSVFRYDPITGHIHWTKRLTGRMKKSGIAGGPSKFHGYTVIRTAGKLYKAHRIAWLLQTNEMPPNILDHINGIRTDNRWVNLRAATIKENARNRISNTNTSGHKGIRFHPASNTWAARIKMNRREHSKHFPALDQALAYVIQLRTSLHGEFANHE